MADKPAKKAAEATPDKPKRKTLTAQEKVAKLQADLAAALEKANADANKKSDALKEQRAKLVSQRDERNVKIAEIDAELERLQNTVTVVADEPDPVVGPEGQTS
jgi:septal ring factor EnvC (AmiA/AmiB activator)